jgi:hypothetical protein
VYKRLRLKEASFQPAFSQKLRVSGRVSVLSKKSLPDGIKKSSQWFTKSIGKTFQRHRNGLLKTSKRFFFHFRQSCIFLAESRLKDAPFSYNRLHTSIYKQSES